MDEKEIGFCYHVGPKEKYIHKVNPEFHRCRLKELMGFEIPICVATTYTDDFGESGFYEYSAFCAKDCPLFTKDKVFAERTEKVVKDLKLPINK